MARTMNVYGRRKANWTIHIDCYLVRMTGSPVNAETQNRIKLVDQSVMSMEPSGICVDLPSYSLE